MLELLEINSIRNFYFKTSEDLESELTVSAIQMWIGVRDSELTFQDFRLSNKAEAVKLRELASAVGDKVLNKKHYRGLFLSNIQLVKLKKGSEIRLTSIASFSRSKKIAYVQAKAALGMSKTFNLDKGKAVVIEVVKLHCGTDVSPFASSLKGQDETISSGYLQVMFIEIDKDDIVRIKAKHLK